MIELGYIHFFSLLLVFVPLWVSAALKGAHVTSQVGQEFNWFGLGGGAPASEGSLDYNRMPGSRNRFNVLMGFDAAVFNAVGEKKYLELAKRQIATDWQLWAEYSKVYGTYGYPPLYYTKDYVYDPNKVYKKYGYVIRNGKITPELQAQIYDPQFQQVPYTTAPALSTAVGGTTAFPSLASMGGNKTVLIVGAVGLVGVFLLMKR